MVAADIALRVGMPAKSNAFSTWSGSRIQHDRPEACCAVYDSSQRMRWASKRASDPAAAEAPKIAPNACEECAASRNWMPPSAIEKRAPTS